MWGLRMAEPAWGVCSKAEERPLGIENIDSRPLAHTSLDSPVAPVRHPVLADVFALGLNLQLTRDRH